MQGGWPLKNLSLLAEEIYSVSHLTQAIKELLEGNFPSLWVEGEISNFRVPSSGHFYFTLKDASSQIRAVMFRSRNAGLPFIPEDGLKVICRADLSVYSARGEYQLIINGMEPKGQGALQLAFEALKRKLAAEGLFAESAKMSLPVLPQIIGLITSPSGAAVRDILKVLWRRYPNLQIRLFPVRVQGEMAKHEIADAIQTANLDGRCDLIILGRGGGSLEDLWAFNEEIVARAVASSQIPIVSAVGHEIDFTITDFVADLRAPTPSAAAEMVMPEKRGLVERLRLIEDRLYKAINKELEQDRERLLHLSQRLFHPGKRIQEGYIRLDEGAERLKAAMRRTLHYKLSLLESSTARFYFVTPEKMIQDYVNRLELWHRDLLHLGFLCLERKRQQWKEMAGRLGALSPLAVLARGYSIARKIPSRQVLRNVENVNKGDPLEIILAQGSMKCLVDTVVPGPQADYQRKDDVNE